MDSRLFFVVGDLAASLFAGALTGLLVCWLVGPGWNMWLAMVSMMALGMVFGIVLWLPLSIHLGAMEVMVPVMLSSMLAGMAVGMGAAMDVMPAVAAAAIGAVCGLISIVFVWILNNGLRGVTPAAVAGE